MDDRKANQRQGAVVAYISSSRGICKEKREEKGQRMWRKLWPGGLLRQGMPVAVGRNPQPSRPQNPLFLVRLSKAVAKCSSPPCYPHPLAATSLGLWRTVASTAHPAQAIDTNTNGTAAKGGGVESITYEEAKKLMRLVNVEALKMKLGREGKEVIGYPVLLEACESMGVARSQKEAVAFARVLDEAGVILLFRDKVYLHPDKLVDLVRRAVPLALTPDDDPMRDELERLQEKKEEIDVLAHKQVRRILWCGLGLAVVQVALFFRLTFWEFSWDVMEPIAFFTTTTGIVIGYAYFLFTARDPTYQDLMKRLFLSRQRKLFKKHNFDVNRFKELQQKCKTTLDASASIKNRAGLELELEDALHRD